MKKPPLKVLESGKHKGEKAQIKVKVNSVKTQELPELDDDFAQEASEFDTLKDLKADIRKACEQAAEGRQATNARDAFLVKLQEEVEIPVPKGVLDKAVSEHLKGMTLILKKLPRSRRTKLSRLLRRNFATKWFLTL